MTIRKTTSQDVGLEAGLVFSRFFFHTDHLHYGYWPSDLDVRFENLQQAQDAYCDLLIAQIPPSVRTILDVGCGTGALAERLMARGFKVDCVSPSPFLIKQTSQRLNGSGQVYESRFEDFEPDQRYDLALFSESFQYLDLPLAMAKLERVLAPDGLVLICDFFRKEVSGTSRIGGGHRLSKFQAAVAASPFDVVTDMDITDRTAPTMDLANDICLNVLSPIWKTVGEHLDSSYPRTMRLVRWTFRKRFEKIEVKYLHGTRTGAHFAHFKTYRLILMRRNGSGGTVVVPHSGHLGSVKPRRL